MNPPSTTAVISGPSPRRIRSGPIAKPTIIGAWPDRMPTSPATPRATTVEASPDQSSRSGVTTWTSRGMR